VQPGAILARGLIGEGGKVGSVVDALLEQPCDGAVARERVVFSIDSGPGSSPIDQRREDSAVQECQFVVRQLNDNRGVVINNVNVESGGVNEADLVGLEQVGVGIARPPDVNGVGGQTAEVVVLEGHKAEKRGVGEHKIC